MMSDEIDAGVFDLEMDWLEFVRERGAVIDLLDPDIAGLVTLIARWAYSRGAKAVEVRG